MTERSELQTLRARRPELLSSKSISDTKIHRLSDIEIVPTLLPKFPDHLWHGEVNQHEVGLELLRICAETESWSTS